MLSHYQTGDLTDFHSKQYHGQFEYFDLGKKKWMNLSNAAILPFLPHNALLVVAERSLFTVVASDIFHPNDEKGFFQYDAKLNRWKQLQTMIGFHKIRSTQIVYLDDFMYLISDQHVERYNLAEQQWEVLPSFSISFYKCTSAVAYEGNVLVCGIGDTGTVTHFIHQYNPSTNTWQILLSQREPPHVNQYPRPVLFEYQGQVYRVTFKKNGQFGDSLFNNDIPVVDKLNIQSRHIDGNVLVETVNQDLVAGSKIEHAFCIQDQVFVESKGFVLLTGLKMNHGVADDPALERIWVDFIGHMYARDAINIVSFTFDKKKLGWAP